MNTKNITLKESLKTLKTRSADPNELDLKKLFTYGATFANDTFAVATLQELCYRGASDIVANCLDILIARDKIQAESTFATTLANALCDLDRTSDPFLIEYGRAMRDKGVFLEPRRWLQANAQRYLRFHRSGMVKHARPWAKEILDEAMVNAQPFSQGGDGPVIPEVVDDE